MQAGAHTEVATTIHEPPVVAARIVDLKQRLGHRVDDKPAVQIEAKLRLVQFHRHTVFLGIEHLLIVVQRGLRLPETELRRGHEGGIDTVLMVEVVRLKDGNLFLFIVNIAHMGIDEEKEIAILQPDNFDHQDRVYATLVASPKFGFWQPQATLHYYQQMFDAEKYGVPMKLNKPEFSFYLNSWFVIDPTFKALVQVNYTGSNHWCFMYRGSNFSVGARLQKTFLKGQLSATLYANDIFRTAKTKINTYYAIGQTAQDVYTYTQCVGLSLSYNFNVTNSKYKGTGAGNDERNRL